MSAFIVDDATINALVGFYIANNCGDRKDSFEMAQELINENYASVNCRYRENDKPHKQAFDNSWIKRVDDLKPVDMITIARCYEYQACEHEEYESSEAAKITKTVISKAYQLGGFSELTESHKLPGADKAPWGLNDNSEIATKLVAV